MPYSVKGYEFIGYVDEAMSQECDHEHWLDAKADPAEMGTQTVTLDDVPVDVVRFRVNYLNADGEIESYYDTEVLTLTAGATQEVTVGPTPTPTPTPLPSPTPIPTTVVTLQVTNAYGLATDQAKYSVTYNSTEGEAKSATGTVDYTVEDGLGSCTATFVAEGEDIAVTSVKLSNPTNDIPFEWLDYAEPQAVTDGSLALDVTANKFAGGAGSADDPYLVGNPRQLNNVRDNCGTETSYKQICDIDFEGSCGLTVSVSVEDYAIKSGSTPIDETARFYNSGKGWTTIGSEDNAFVGSYDGDGHTIDSLALYAPGDDNQGLFGYCSTCKFSNLTLGEHCTVVGYNYVGGLAGILVGDQATLSNCDIQATVAGDFDIGGVAGSIEVNNDSPLTNCSFSGTAYGSSCVAGCTGYMGMGTATTITNCTVAGDIYVVYNEDSGSPAGAGFAADAYPYLTFADCSCTSTIHAIGNAESEDFAIGGVVAEVFDGYCDLSFTFEGTDAFAPEFDFNDYKSEEQLTVGGVMGVLYGGETHLEALKTALAQVTTVNPTGIPDGDTCGKYCGSPKVDSL